MGQAIHGGSREPAGWGAELVAHADAPQLAPQPANDTPAVDCRRPPGGRRLGLIENGAVLLLNGGLHRGHLRFVVPDRIRMRVPDGGLPIVFDDIGCQPLEMLEVPRGVGEGHQPVTKLEGAKPSDGAPQGESRRRRLARQPVDEEDPVSTTFCNHGYTLTCMEGRPAPNGLVTRLFLAGAVTLTGDAVTLVALPLTAVIVLHASPAELALVGLAQALPILLLSVPLGAWVDRRTQRWPLLIASDLARAVLLLIVPLAAVAGTLSLPLLIAIAFLLNCAGTVFELGLAGWIPRVLSGDALHKANARIELSRSGALVVGPMLAGALVAVVTAPIALLVDAASFLGSAPIIGSARRAEPPQRPLPSNAFGRPY